MAPRSASAAVAPCTLLHAKAYRDLATLSWLPPTMGCRGWCELGCADVAYDKRRRLKSVLASVSGENELLAGGSAGTSKSHLVKCAGA